MNNNTEIELKLLISDEDLQKLLNLAFVKRALRPNSKEVRALSTSYYDTSDLVLRSYGIAYRVRDKGDGSFEATVKTNRKKQGGFAERLELNIPLKEDKPVLDGFKAMGLDYELSELVPNGVKKLFTVDVERVTYILDYEDSVLELAIDKGYIIAGSQRDKIDELEIELKEGRAEALLKFAELAGKEVILTEEERSKYARGLALCKIPDIAK